MGSATPLLRLETDTERRSEGVHPGRDGKVDYPRSHNLETGAHPRNGNDPESKTGVFGLCVTLQEGKNSARRAWEKKDRELEEFHRSAQCNDRNKGFLR